MGLLTKISLLQMTYSITVIVIMTRSSMADSNSCSNHTDAEMTPTSFNPVNNIQIFTSSPAEPSTNGTGDILKAVKELAVAMATLQSQQDDLARVTATIATQCQHHHSPEIQRQPLQRSLGNESTSSSSHFGDQLEEISEALSKLNDTIWPRLDDLAEAIAAQQHDHHPGDSTALAESTTSEEPSSVGRTLPRDCHEILRSGQVESGVYDIQPDRLQGSIQVSCDMETDGGGWTVFQRRGDGSEDFYRNWTEYRAGFGEAAGEHWLGNDILHLLTVQKTYMLRVDLWAFDGDTAYAEYHEFSVCGENDFFRLKLGDYVGTAGDSMSHHRHDRDALFSTSDADNDAQSSYNCATRFHNGWWNKSCLYANPNGIYRSNVVCPAYDGVMWRHWKGTTTSMRKVEMKIRPS